MKNTFIFITILGLLTACGSKTTEEQTATAPSNKNAVKLTEIQIKNAGIVTGSLEQKQISSVLKVNGKIEVPPQNVVSISVPMGGYLKNTGLLVGMNVRKGQLLAVIEDQQYIQLQQDYLTAKSKINFLENEYLRQKDLNQSKASSDKVYQQSEAEFRGQRVLLSALAEKLKLAGINPTKLTEDNISRTVSIYSPISGYVSKINSNIGKYVSPTEVMFELINPTDIHLALKVFEKDVDKLFIGQKILTFTNNRPDKKYVSEVIMIGKDLTADRVSEVQCHFKNYDKALIPGTYMNAEVEVKNSSAYVLPEDAIVRYEGKHYAFIKKAANEFEMKEVQIGNTENGFTEILNPDKTTQNFVVKGAYALLMSLKNKSEE
ncbi:efflux RND transporter periplasmic adaptor subunit [Runella sp.]|jgi:cobalt-zinc-cadmium efflux system membrane fusion protein|uniref:efflux RND transporter periplasmic adaptor subunit n=1 Tax=Runella sp. TaxID=1960881 RepID=UPI00262A580F|nr:efflux RND transporter periplasmic adaptor subunit [Runella sp.]